MSTDIEKRIGMMVAWMRRDANLGYWSGISETPYFRRCKHIDYKIGFVSIFTRDIGYHTSGWWKNPDYERCFHLSLSFFDTESGERGPRNEELSQLIVKTLFGDDASKLWCESPYSEDGKRNQVWHYRLFCDEGWQPIIPRGEVYSRELTEAGWKSYSDVQAEMAAVQKLISERNV